MARSSKEEVMRMKESYVKVGIAAAKGARAKWSEEKREDQEEVGESSFRILYYGATEAAVPFTWESQPGTPKHPMFTTNNTHKNDHILPPLTPPPSYTHNTFSPSPSPSPAFATPSRKKTRKPGFFSGLLSSFSRKPHRHITPLSSSTSYSGPLSWSTSSSGSSPVSSPYRPGRSSVSYPLWPKSQSPYFYDDDDEEVSGSPTKDVMCFGYKKQGCYSIINVRNSVSSIKGQ